MQAQYDKIRLVLLNFWPINGLDLVLTFLKIEFLIVFPYFALDVLRLTVTVRGLSYTCPNGRLTENVFKRISANSNPKAQKRFRKIKMTSFFG